MAIFEAYSLDQLNRLLTLSKWMLIACGIIFVVFVVVNQWLASRISSLQDEENKRTQQALRASRTELLRTKAKTNELSAELSRFVAPRSLLFGLLQSLPNALAAGTRSAADKAVAMSLLLTDVMVDLLALVWCEGDTTIAPVDSAGDHRSRSDQAPDSPRGDPAAQARTSRDCQSRGHSGWHRSLLIRQLHGRSLARDLCV